MSLSSLLNTTGTLQRKTTAVDDSLGAANTWSDVTGVVAIPCSLQPVTARDRMMFLQRNVVITHYIYFDRDVGAKVQDRWLTADGRTFNVVGYFDQGGRNRVYRIEAREQAY